MRQWRSPSTRNVAKQAQVHGQCWATRDANKQTVDVGRGNRSRTAFLRVQRQAESEVERDRFGGVGALDQVTLDPILEMPCPIDRDRADLRQPFDQRRRVCGPSSGQLFRFCEQSDRDGINNRRFCNGQGERWTLRKRSKRWRAVTSAQRLQGAKPQRNRRKGLIDATAERLAAGGWSSCGPFAYVFCEAAAYDGFGVDQQPWQVAR